jgi:DNA gyrase inhibitor GyrI
MAGEKVMSGKGTIFSTSPKLLIAFVEHTGSYSTIGDTMRELKSWIDAKGLEQSGYPFCLYYDNPQETPEPKLRSEACIPVLRPFESEGKFQFKELKPADVAETRHQGPQESFPSTYGPFLESLLSSGYQLLGPAREYYSTVSDVKGPGTGFLIQQPIRRK